METALIQTKLQIPRQKRELINREVLHQKLDQSLESRLTLISAPAGFGKTSLLTSWLHRDSNTGFSAAWLSLDEQDNDPVRFFSYFVAALKSICPKIKLELPKLKQFPPADYLIDIINTLVGVDYSMVLVLDDYHVVDEPEIAKALVFFLEHQPENLHLIVSSRMDPLFPLAKLRAKGELVEIRATDLSFSREEANPYLITSMNLDLSPKNIDLLVQKTEGWIVGLQLAAVTIRNFADSSEFIKSFTRSSQYMMDYLVDEVLDKLDPDLVLFLLKTTILNQFNRLLCNFVVEIDTSHEMIERLEAMNLFVVQLDPQREWFRYHRLFRDLLGQRARNTLSEKLDTLNLKAGKWYEASFQDSRDEKMLEEAVYHYVEGRQFQLAADLIKAQADRKWSSGEIVLLKKWIDWLPEAIVFENPKLSIYCGWTLLTSGEHDKFLNWVKNSEKNVQNLDISKDKSDLQGRLLFLRSVAATFSGFHKDTADLAEKALDCLDTDNITWRSGAVMSLGDAKASLGKVVEADLAYADAVSLSLDAGNVYMSLLAGFKRIMMKIQMGQLYPALEHCDQLTDVFERDGMSNSPMAGCVASYKGSILCELNRFEEGVDLLEKGLDIADKDPHIGMKGWCYLNLIRARLQLGEPDKVQQLIDQLKEYAAETQLPPMINGPLDVSQAGLWLMTGDLNKVHEWIKKKKLDQDPVNTDPLTVSAYLLMVRYLFLQNKYQQIENILNRFLPVLKADQRISQLIEVLTFKAISNHQSGNPEQALRILEEAFRLGEKNGFRVIFRDCRVPINLLELACQRDIKTQYIQEIINLVKTSADGTLPIDSNSQPLEPLTRREQEVLNLLADGLSNQEICDTLFLAMDTVKGHTRRIYGKLDVHSRSQAVAAARKFGILS